jgi:chromosome segregation ATPase
VLRSCIFPLPQICYIAFVIIGEITMALTEKDKKDIVNLMSDLLEQIVLPQFQDLREDIKRLDNRIDKLESRMEGVEFRLGKLEAKVDRLDTRMVYLEDAVADHGRQLRELTPLVQEIRKTQLSEQLTWRGHEKRLVAVERAVAV